MTPSSLAVGNASRSHSWLAGCLLAGGGKDDCACLGLVAGALRWDNPAMGKLAAIGEWARSMASSMGAQRRRGRQRREELDSRLILEIASGTAAGVERLLEMGADPNVADKRGCSPLMHAAKASKMPLLSLLAPLSNHAAKNEDGDTALMLAVRHGRLGPIEALAKQGGMIACARGQTPLMAAARSEHSGIVRSLLPWSDPLAADGDGWDALMHAAWVGCEGSVQALLPVSDCLRKSRQGSAAQLAQMAGHAEVSEKIRAWALSRSERGQLELAAAKGKSAAKPMRI